MRSPIGTALVSAAFALVAARVASAALKIADADGKPVAEASALCLDPASAEPVRSKDGLAKLPAGCRRARCDAAGYLTSEIEVKSESSTCTLRKGLVVEGELPASAIGGGVEIGLRGVAATSAAANIAIAKPSTPTVTRFTLPAVAPGRYALEVSRAADGWSCRADLGPLAAGRRRVNPAWRDPFTIAVRVKEAADKPASSIRVRAFPAPHQDDEKSSATAGAWACGPVSAKPAVTDASGSASVVAASGEETLVVAGDWKDPRGIDAEFVDRPSATPVGLTLAKPVRLKAKLLDEKDHPVGCKATLEIASPVLQKLVAAVPGGETKGTCALDGTLAIGPFVSIAGTLQIVPSPGMPMRIALEAPAAGTTADLGALHVKTGEAIRVMVRDPEGHPVSKAKVVARGMAGVVLSVAGTTDESGDVDLVGFPKGASMHIEVRASGFIFVWKDSLPISGSPFTIVVTPGGVVTGSVHDRDGAPISGATVRIAATRGRSSSQASSAADGTFSLEAVADGEYDVMGSAAGFAASQPVHVALANRRLDHPVELVLDPAPFLRGHVVTASGASVAGARVMLIPQYEVEDLESARATMETLSGSDGSFEFAIDVDPSLLLVAVHAGMAPGVERAPANAQKQGDVSVVLGDPAGLRVHTSLRAGTSRRIRVTDGLGLGHSAQVTEGGETLIDTLAPGEGKVSLSPGAERAVTLAAGQIAEVTLDDGPWIEGIVTADQAPAPRVLVHATKEGEGSYSGRGSVFTDQSGAYRLDGLGEGLWRVVAIGEDGRGEKVVTLPDAGPTRLDFDLRMARAEITVLRSDRMEPIPYLGMNVRPAGATCRSIGSTTAWGDPGDLGFDLNVGDNGCLSATTDAAGVARVVLAGPGTYALSISDDGYEPYDAPLGVGSGTTTRRILLTPKSKPKSDRATVHVRLLTDPPGLAGTLTCIAGGSTSSNSPVSVQDDCSNARPGPLEILFHVDGYGAAHTSVDVTEGAELTVDLQVVRGGKLIVPVSTIGASAPDVVDASGYSWGGAARHDAWIAGIPTDLPDVGKAWVFNDLPPGMYTVTVDGATRSPVPLSSGGTAIAN